MTTVTCPGCQERDQRITALERRVAELEAIVRDLVARLGTNATNSGTPPSANPPGAPKPVTKQRTGKRPGGQPGHPPRLKRRLPPERLHKVIPFVPSHCDRCHEPLPPQPAPDDPEPTWHQVAELPELAAQVTEYQGHYRTCPWCGQLNHAPIPADLKATSVGPRLAATLGYLAGSHRASTRGLEEITEDVFDVPIALGTVANLRTEVSDALAPAHAEAVQFVRDAAVKNVDETGWKLAGQLCWLWVAATGTVAAFLIHAKRGWKALAALLGEPVKGLVCSDRWSAYDRLSPFCRQICWATSRGTSRSWSIGAGRRHRWGGGCSASPSGYSWSGTSSAGAAVTGGNCNSGWTARRAPWSGLSRLGGGAPTARRRPSARTCWSCCRRCGGS